MPYIDCKLTETLDEEKREAVKTKLGRAISLLHKPESYLMVGFTEGYALYFAGKKTRKRGVRRRQSVRRGVRIRLREDDRRRMRYSRRGTRHSRAGGLCDLSSR